MESAMNWPHACVSKNSIAHIQAVLTVGPVGVDLPKGI